MFRDQDDDVTLMSGAKAEMGADVISSVEGGTMKMIGAAG